MMRFFDRLVLMIISVIDSKDTHLQRRYIKKRYKVEIGKYTYGYRITDIAGGTKIGSFCSIASGVKIGLMNHPVNFVSTNPFLYYASRGFIDRNVKIPQKGSVIIEDDVWIGANSVVLPGVKIGKGAIVGAGAVVTKSVPPYAIVCGVPAKVIKYRFDDSVIAGLTAIDWPNWEDDKIKKSIDFFYNPKKFIDGNERGII